MDTHCHIDMDAFFASVEQRDNPELKGKPVAVGGDGLRGVVAAASYEARKYGVHSALSSKIAKARCPHLIFVRPRFDAYKSVSLVIRSIFKEYTDLIEPLSLDEAYLDVTSNKKGIATATEIAIEIKNRIQLQTDLTASAGVSINKFLAKIASDMDKPDGIYVIKPNKVDQFVADLEVSKFFGVGKVTSEKMHQLGIRTGLDLRAKSKPELVRLFGKAGSYFYNVSRGEDDRPVVPNRPRKSLGVEDTFEKDYGNLSELLEIIDELSDRVYTRIKKANAFGRTLTLKVKFADFTQITRSNTVPSVISKKSEIKLVASDLMRHCFEEGMKIRLLGITLSNFESDIEEEQQLTLTF